MDKRVILKLYIEILKFFGSILEIKKLCGTWRVRGRERRLCMYLLYFFIYIREMLIFIILIIIILFSIKLNS